MATILDTLKKGTEYLEKHGVEEARLNMEHLIAHVLKIDRMQLYLDFDRPIPEPALVSLRDLTKRRSRGEPLQHLLGTVDFFDLEFKTDARALIPRPETEEMVSLLTTCREWPEQVSILDVGCGSGVIGLSLARFFGARVNRVVLSDISPEALALAQENAELLGMIDRVEFAQSDLFSHVTGYFDLIAANLPYVPNSDQTQLSREVQQDPPLALYGGEDGTEIIQRFLSDAAEHLESGGMVAIEFGIGQSEGLRILAEDLGFFPAEIKADLSGIDRFIFAVKSA
ncbi:MAG: peptide chain release factor N(5)-glutamine methyltransferase [Verrucomicrobiales bacterium]|nr:peptide chain release factor N(5)-glutamine methyltransferase [Verrucomicrobiales bacterium]